SFGVLHGCCWAPRGNNASATARFPPHVGKFDERPFSLRPALASVGQRTHGPASSADAPSGTRLRRQRRRNICVTGATANAVALIEIASIGLQPSPRPSS